MYISDRNPQMRLLLPTGCDHEKMSVCIDDFHVNTPRVIGAGNNRNMHEKPENSWQTVL